MDWIFSGWVIGGCFIVGILIILIGIIVYEECDEEWLEIHKEELERNYVNLSYKDNKKCNMMIHHGNALFLLAIVLATAKAFRSGHPESGLCLCGMYLFMAWYFRMPKEKK